MAVQLFGIFVAVKKEAFNSHLPEILPLVVKQLYGTEDDNAPGRYVKCPTMMEEIDHDDPRIKNQQCLKDHLTIQAQELLLKIFKSCKDLCEKDKYQEFVSIIGGMGIARLILKFGALFNSSGICYRAMSFTVGSWPFVGSFAREQALAICFKFFGQGESGQLFEQPGNGK